MPFQELSILDQRAEFCGLALAPGANVRELCRRMGISPPTGYKWLGRYEKDGRAGLVDRSRRPLSSPGMTAPAIEALVLDVRRALPLFANCT